MKVGGPLCLLQMVPSFECYIRIPSRAGEGNPPHVAGNGHLRLGHRTPVLDVGAPLLCHIKCTRIQHYRQPCRLI